MPDQAHPLIERVRESLAGTHDLLGELGVDEHGILLYLAREVASGKLVGISVTQDSANADEYSVEVRRTLGETVSVQGSVCPECNTPLPDLERFCFQCGADLSGVIAADGTPEATRVLNALTAATTDSFEILGKMDREGRAGTVYFARELSTRRVVALRVRRAETGDAVQAEYVVKQTQVFRVPAVVKRVASFETPYTAAAAYAGASSPPSSATLAGGQRSAMDAGAASGSVSGSAADPSAAGTAPAYAGERTAPSRRAPLLVGVAALLLAVTGYFALRDSGAPKSSTTANTSGGTGNSAAGTGGGGATSVGTVANGTTNPIPGGAPNIDAPAAANGGAASGTTASSSAPVDSGTIRLGRALPAGARITVDGFVVRGRAYRVKPGSHQVVVTAPGFQPFTQRVEVGAHGNKMFEPTLVALVANTSSVSTAAPNAADSKPKGTSNCRVAMKREEWNSAFTSCGTDAIDGDIYAASSLGRLYAQGLGVKRNPDESVHWYEMAAKGGDHDAQVQMGIATRDGNGIKRDKGQALKWFKQAADAGDVIGTIEYAAMLEKGDGVSRDETNARVWYRKAMEKGNAVAARRLARMSETGAGGAKSDADAAVLYQRAATLGDVESAMTIAKWYRDGHGVTKSATDALVWYRKAASLGNADAEKEIRRLEKGE